MRIGVVLPSYNYGFEGWSSNLDRFIDSLDNLSEIDNFEFLCNFQNINSEDCHVVMGRLFSVIKRVNPTWSYKYVWREDKYDEVSMVKIRNDCMMLDPECDIYLFVDDDMKFNPGAALCYNDTISEFEKDPDLGLVMNAGFLGGYRYKRVLKYAVKKHWNTNKGLFIRNLHEQELSPIYSKNVLIHHKGGCEDMIAAFEVIKHKKKLATYFNNPTTHKGAFMEASKEESGGRKDDRYNGSDEIHKLEITFKSSEAYLKAEFDLEFIISDIRDYQKALQLVYDKTNE